MLVSPELEVDGSFGGFGNKSRQTRKVEDFKGKYLERMHVLGEESKRRRNVESKIVRLKHI